MLAEFDPSPFSWPDGWPSKTIDHATLQSRVGFTKLYGDGDHTQFRHHLIIFGSRPHFEALEVLQSGHRFFDIEIEGVIQPCPQDHHVNFLMPFHEVIPNPPFFPLFFKIIL